jgi:integrase
MHPAKIRMPDGRTSWTALDDSGEPVPELRSWVIHLEELSYSPNTVRPYLLHLTRLGRFLRASGKSFRDITIPDYDEFLRACRYGFADEPPSPQLIVMPRAPRSSQLGASTRNQIHLAVKCFYRYLVQRDDFEFAVGSRLRAYDGHRTYKPFLEHINARKLVRKKDAYLRGDVTRVQKRVVDQRLAPEAVLQLIQACHLMRDALLLVILYNTGLRIGEALGLRHTDIDVKNQIFWVVPREDNENEARAKSGRTRAIPVHDYLIGMYVDYLTSEEYLDAWESGTPYVFCNVQRGRIGRAMSRSYAGNLVKYLKRRTGIHWHPHLLRHTHSSEAIAAGYSLLEIADRLGHVSPQTTAAFYRHLFSHEVRQLYLTGPERVQKRLAEIREAERLGRDLRWS